MTQTQALRITCQGLPEMSRALASALEEERVTVSGLVVDGTTETMTTAQTTDGSSFGLRTGSAWRAQSSRLPGEGRT